jgi:hypothetical protein
LGIEDEAVPLRGVVAVVLAESFNQYARDENILNTAPDLVTAHQVPRHPVSPSRPMPGASH